MMMEVGSGSAKLALCSGRQRLLRLGGNGFVFKFIQEFCAPRRAAPQGCPSGVVRERECPPGCFLSRSQGQARESVEKRAQLGLLGQLQFHADPVPWATHRAMATKAGFCASFPENTECLGLALAGHGAHLKLASIPRRGISGSIKADESFPMHKASRSSWRPRPPTTGLFRNCSIRSCHLLPPALLLAEGALPICVAPTALLSCTSPRQ